MVAWRYEISLRVVNNISRVSAARGHVILYLSPGEFFV